jgi:Kef-type K+ transport system membrane component KefB
MKEDQFKKDINYQIAGWILFVFCAILFIASSLKNHDTLAFIGSVFFLIACIIFLIPVFWTYKIAKNATEQPDDK